MALAMKHWQDQAAVAVGAWMAASPWVLAYQGKLVATGNAVALGAAIAVVALIALVRAVAWTEWTNLVLGVWLMISPWELDFNATHAAMWNALAAGAATALLALWTLGTDRDIGGGWWKPAT